MAIKSARRNDSAVTRKGRPGTGRPLTIHINIGADDSSEFNAQAQVLADRCGISRPLAGVVLSLLRGGSRE